MEIQLRSEIIGIKVVSTFEEAFTLCQEYKSIWKISFYTNKSRYRFVQCDDSWENRPLQYLDKYPYITQEIQDIEDNIKEKMLKAGFILCENNWCSDKNNI